MLIAAERLPPEASPSAQAGRPRRPSAPGAGFQLAFPDLFPPVPALTGLDRRALLFGHDETPGIVSVTSDRQGRAYVWRRVGGRVVCEEENFPNWFLLSRPELLGDLPVRELGSSELASTPNLAPGEIGLGRLNGENHFQHVVLTDRLDEVEAHVLEAAKLMRGENEAEEPASRLLYVRPPVEQYLTVRGRTYFKGMAYGDLRRMQFDLETTGLGFDLDRIFMVSIKDSDGFTAVLERPGEVDLSAHVDFAALGSAAMRAGARVQGPVGQREFLRDLGIETRAAVLKTAAGARAPEIDAALARLTETGPRGMGELFKVVALTDPKLGALPGFG